MRPAGRASRQPRRLGTAPPPTPANLWGSREPVALQPYASRLIIFSHVTRGSVALHALISHGVMTTAGPVQTGPAPLVRRCLPPFSRPPPPKRHIRYSGADDSGTGRRYLATPTRVYFERRPWADGGAGAGSGGAISRCRTRGLLARCCERHETRQRDTCG